MLLIHVNVSFRTNGNISQGRKMGRRRARHMDVQGKTLSQTLSILNGSGFK